RSERRRLPGENVRPAVHEALILGLPAPPARGARIRELDRSRAVRHGMRRIGRELVAPVGCRRRIERQRAVCVEVQPPPHGVRALRSGRADRTRPPGPTILPPRASARSRGPYSAAARGPATLSRTPGALRTGANSATGRRGRSGRARPGSETSDTTRTGRNGT